MTSSADRLTWVGHATVLLELAGARLLTDPLLRPRVGHLWRRPPTPPDPGPLDAVLLSHLHRDHLDLPSLRQLDAGAVVVAPRGGGQVLRRLPHAVAELAAGEELRFGTALVRAVPAVHDGRRSPLGGGTADAIGFVVEAGPRVYFAGDTERFDGMAAIAPCDVALLPVWGWGPTLGPGHMDPEQAAAAAALVRPAVAVPIHWGTYAPGPLRTGEPLSDEPARRFATRCAAVVPQTRVQVLAPGGSLALAG